MSRVAHVHARTLYLGLDSST
eukprot:SAG31_NODE_3314_length_4427_cov_3.391174_1_plen_20_part_10